MNTVLDTIPTWTEPETLAYCCEVAANAGRGLGLECGTYMGASLAAMLMANKEMHIWAVDKFMVFGTEFLVRKVFCKQAIESGRCELIVADSAKAFEMLAPHVGGHLDFAWVDDGHAEEDLRRDIKAFLPLLKSGGILFGHDWDGNNDVARGVLSMIPLEKLTFPVPRVWQYTKP